MADQPTYTAAQLEAGARAACDLMGIPADDWDQEVGGPRIHAWQRKAGILEATLKAMGFVPAERSAE